MSLIEEMQAAATQRFEEALAAYRAATTELNAAAAAAKDVGVSVNKLSDLAEVSRGKMDGWIKAAPPRAKPAESAPDE
jgi:hypothetical protein